MSQALSDATEKLNAFVAEVKTELKGKADADKVSVVKNALDDMGERLRAVEVARTEGYERRNMSASDAAVERAFGGTTDEDGHLVSRGAPLDPDATPFVGTDEGVVKLFGTDEAGYWEPGLLDSPEPMNDWHAKALDLIDRRNIVRAVSSNGSRRADKALARHMAKGPGVIGKVFSENTASDLIPEFTTPVLQRAAELMRRSEAVFPTMNIPRGGLMRNPFQTRGVQPFIHGQPALNADPANMRRSRAAYTNRSVEAVTFAVVMAADLDAVEDAILPWIPLARLQHAEAHRDGFEDALFNADDATTHQDTGFDSWNPRSRWETVGAGDQDHRRGFTGLRAEATDRSSTYDGSGDQTVKAAIGHRARLDAVHGADGSLVYFTSPEHYLSRVITDSNVLTVDKYGEGATIRNGEVGRIGNAPLILSDFITADLAATGLYTGSGTYTGMLLVDTSRYPVARRRGLSVAVSRRDEQHTLYLTSTTRKTLHSIDGSSVKNVLWVYKLASTPA